jgi:tetratricopeptide (TPR) repeat protein
VQSAWTDFKRPPAAGLVTDPATRLGNVSGTRYAIWKTAVKTFRAHPLDGTGAGTFEFDWNRSGGQESVRDAHSLYLEGLAELGIVGGALLIALVAALALAGFGRAGGAARSRDTAVVAGVSAFVVVAAQAGVDWIWESTATWVLGLLAIAIVMGRDGAERTRARVLPRLGWTLAAGVCALLTLPVLVSTSELRSSQRAAARGDLRAASQAADNAVDSEPWAASPFVQRALVEERGGRLEAALTDLRRAQSRQGYDWRIPLLRARVAAEAGHTPEALAAYRRARALRPKSAFFGPAG